MTEVATTPDAELAELEAAEAAAAQGALAGLDDVDLTIPVLKVAQSLTQEVTDGDAEPGHYVNALTGEDLGGEISFVVAAAHKGRFYKRTKAMKDLPGEIGQVYVASEDRVPDNWPDEWKGQAFADLPESEEQYKVRVNSGEIEWDSGPAIRTTFNFIGFRPEEPSLPLRLSLMRSGAPTARKIITLVRAAGVPWKHVFNLGTDQRTNAEDQPYFVPSVIRGDQTSAELRREALELSQRIQSSGYQAAGDEALDEDADKRKAAEQATGGIDVA